MSEDSAEQVRKTFIEQVRMRKAALEQAKLAKQKAEEDAKRAAEEEEKKKQEAAEAEVRAAEEAKAAEAKAQAEAEAAAQKEAHAEADVDAIEADVEEKVDDSESNAEVEVDAKEEAAPEEKTEEAVVAPENSISVFLENVHKAEGIEDPYTMEYPAGLEKPDPRYKKETMKYTYGPTFLLQFKTKINFQVDEQFKASVLSKIVIPPSSGNRRNNSTRSLRDPALCQTLLVTALEEVPVTLRDHPEEVTGTGIAEEAPETLSERAMKTLRSKNKNHQLNQWPHWCQVPTDGFQNPDSKRLLPKMASLLLDMPQMVRLFY